MSSEEIVKALEKALTEAKEGKVASLAVITVGHDGNIGFSLNSKEPVPVGLVGAIEWAKSFLLHKTNMAQIEEQKKAMAAAAAAPTN